MIAQELVQRFRLGALEDVLIGVVEELPVAVLQLSGDKEVEDVQIAVDQQVLGFVDNQRVEGADALQRIQRFERGPWVGDLVERRRLVSLE